ncbi:hypothetical protein KI387_030936, partial [Taxus chinensis]
GFIGFLIGFHRPFVRVSSAFCSSRSSALRFRRQTMSRKRAAVGDLAPHDMDSKHASLMQDYLLLQDEFATLKDRVHSAKTRRATLLAEVRFLRRRLKELKETPPTPKENLIPSAVPQTTSKKNPVPSMKFHALRKPFRTGGSDHSTQRKPLNDNVSLVRAPKPPIFGNRPDVFVKAVSEKRKISWQDQISLECK